MNWTTVTPIAPGHYWARYSSANPFIESIFMYEGRLAIRGSLPAGHGDWMGNVTADYKWAWTDGRWSKTGMPDNREWWPESIAMPVSPV